MYTGSAAGLLDTLSRTLRFSSWEYDGKQVVYDWFQTKTFKLYLATDLESNEVLWTELLAVVEGAFLGDEGRIISSPNWGSVTVRAAPENMRRVEAFLIEANERITRQVSVTVEVYSLVQNTSDNFEFSLNNLFQGKDYGVSTGGAQATQAAGNTAIADDQGLLERHGLDGTTLGRDADGNVIDLREELAQSIATAARGIATEAGQTVSGDDAEQVSPTDTVAALETAFELLYGRGGTTAAAAAVTAAVTGGSSGLTRGLVAGLTILDPSSKFFGSGGVFNQLSTAGQASLLSSTSMISLDGRVQTVNATTIREVVVAVGASNAGQGAVEQTEQLRSITDGIVVSVRSDILDNGEVHIWYKIDLSDFSSAEGGNVRARLDSRVVESEITLPLGSKLVLNAFQRKASNTSREGTGSPGFFLFGGSRGADNQIESFVVTITPVLIDTSRARQVVALSN